MRGRSDDVLVTIQSGGRERPFYFVVAAYRDVFAAAHLARALGPDFPVCALQPPAGPSREIVALPRLADLVDLYAERIQRSQPRGPYRLGGYSSGALIALEVGRALVATGQSVELVALLEGGPGVPTRLTHRLVRLCRRITRGWRLTPRPGEPRMLRLLRSFLTDDGMYATYTALFGHAVVPYNESPVVLFAAQQRGLTALRIPTGGWDSIVPGIVTEPVPGDHDSCMQPPNIAVLAARLRAHLAAGGEAQPAVGRG